MGIALSTGPGVIWPHLSPCRGLRGSLTLHLKPHRRQTEPIFRKPWSGGQSCQLRLYWHHFSVPCVPNNQNPTLRASSLIDTPDSSGAPVKM